MKRGVADISDYVELRNLIDKVERAKPIPYLLESGKQVRDRALLAFLAATGMRISEALSVKREQLELSHDPDFVVVKDVRILKRRKETIFKDFVLPRKGVLKPLTDLVLEHVRTKNKGPLFDIGRQRAWQIVVFMTGKWCHYFRSQRISFLVNRIRSTTAVADLLGIKKSSTIDHYYKGGWGQFKKELSPKE